MPRDIKHKLLTKDVDAMTGVCAACGPVKLRWRSAPRAGGKRTVACPTPKREERERADNANARKGWLYSVNTGGHGLTVDEAREFVRGKVCALCGTEEGLVVDHCHDTGKLREPLCQSCNKGLGFLRDDPALLRAAAEYVERHREMSP